MFTVKYETDILTGMSPESPDELLDAPALDDLRFAENMRSLREARGMTQAELVRVLKANGWSSVFQTTISRIEKGDRPVRYGEARAIARALGANIERFLLSAEDQELAGRLGWARDRLFSSYQSIQAGAREYAGRRERLESLVAEVREAGFEPTELPTDPSETLAPVTVADELALAIEVLETLTPDRAISTGEMFARDLDKGRE